MSGTIIINTLAGERLAISVQHIVLVKEGEKGRAIIHVVQTAAPILGAIYCLEKFTYVVSEMPE